MVSTPSAPSPEIGHDALLEAVEGGTCAVVDVREPHEFAAGHIPGAVNLPLSRFNPQDLPSGKPVVLVCLAGGRSARALREALGAGVADARHYAPGMNGWRALGGPVTL
jgi:rhodanese-related sulfurtransferase